MTERPPGPGLGEDFADSLDPSVRAKYLELCAAVKHADADER